ncbi:MAG TPA: pyridoxamine 5'-phosphate oxidase family protein [Candidatus Dormibacteraeota bacterium]|nr:pyridoxamine 5'-phosphate oxidase family protein [Candidatus Dormibacteraeota bacterium]
MTTMFHDAQRELQDLFDTRRLADRIEERLVHDFIDEHDARFIAARDMFFLATVDPEGRPNCSYKGGDPGFVRVVDERTLAFPNYDGNGMYLSMGNALATKEVGMLFIDFERRNRMRVNGSAGVDQDDPLMAEYPLAQFIVRVTVREVFPNCPRYIHRYSWWSDRGSSPKRRGDRPSRTGSSRIGRVTSCPTTTRPGCQIPRSKPGRGTSAETAPVPGGPGSWLLRRRRRGRGCVLLRLSSGALAGLVAGGLVGVTAERAAWT